MIFPREEPFKMVPLSFVETLHLKFLENYDIIKMSSF